MLQQFSWTQFFLFSTILSVIWYIILFLIYGSWRIENASNIQRATSPILSNTSDDSSRVQQIVMGSTALPAGLDSISMSSVRFGVADSENINEGSLKSDQLGLVPDVLQDLKEIFRIIATQDGTKQDFFSLLGRTKLQFGNIGSNPNIQHINDFIKAHAPFAINNEEFENLWD